MPAAWAHLSHLALASSCVCSQCLSHLVVSQQRYPTHHSTRCTIHSQADVEEMLLHQLLGQPRERESKEGPCEGCDQPSGSTSVPHDVPPMCSSRARRSSGCVRVSVHLLVGWLVGWLFVSWWVGELQILIEVSRTQACLLPSKHPFHLPASPNAPSMSHSSPWPHLTLLLGHISLFSSSTHSHSFPHSFPPPQRVLRVPPRLSGVGHPVTLCQHAGRAVRACM